MKFKTADLIKNAEDEIAQRKAVDERRIAEATDGVEAAKAEWIATRSEAFTELAKVITRLVRKGQPITREDLPKGSLRDGYGTSLAVFAEFVPRRQTSPSTAELDRLVKLLRASPDEEVTTTALQSLGFRNISNLFR